MQPWRMLFHLGLGMRDLAICLKGDPHPLVLLISSFLPWLTQDGQVKTQPGQELKPPHQRQGHTREKRVKGKLTAEKAYK